VLVPGADLLDHTDDEMEACVCVSLSRLRLSVCLYVSVCVSLVCLLLIGADLVDHTCVCVCVCFCVCVCVCVWHRSSLFSLQGEALAFTSVEKGMSEKIWRADAELRATRDIKPGRERERE